MSVTVGLEVLLAQPARSRKWGRCGLLVNQASVDREVRASQVLLKKLLKERLTVLFTPQHGLSADKQDNMIESGHGIDFMSGLPFYSLYSEVREPTEKMMEVLDTVLIDLQDIGTRVYTFIYTMAGIMRQSSRMGKRVVVLDRPNPIGGETVEGNILEKDSTSFVGEYPLPMRHGMTIGEMAHWMNQVGAIGAELEVVRMKGWKREMHFPDTGRTWIMTSPNMPISDGCEVYPGMVLLEGTNMSEGRGTTMPFLTVGAPYLRNLHEWLDVLRKITDLSGLILRPTVFEPTFHKWAKEACWGVQIVVRDRQKIRPYQLGLGMIIASARLAPNEFKYKDPPYEYETKRSPMQLLLGSSSLPRRLFEMAGAELRRSSLRDLEREWKPALREFLRRRKEVLLYGK